jgi:hypothetical protein
VEVIGLAILVLLIAAFEFRHKDVKQRHDAALDGIRGECNKLSARGLPKKRA